MSDRARERESERERERERERESESERERVPQQPLWPQGEPRVGPGLHHVGHAAAGSVDANQHLATVWL